MTDAAAELSGEATEGAAPEAAPEAAPTASENWLDQLDPGTREYMDNKGWAADDPIQSMNRVLDGYRNAEKMIGGRVKIPEQGDEDGWNDLYKRLGRPDEPDGYELNNLPDEREESLVEFFKGAAHKAGMTAQQADAFLSEYNSYTDSMSQDFEDRLSAQSQQEIDRLRAEWGPEYETNVSAGRRSVQAAGLDQETLAAIEGSIGSAKTMQLFAKLGKHLSEDDFVEGGGEQGFSMSRERAATQLDALKSDPNFMARYMRGDPEALKKFSDLMAITA